MKCIIGVLLFFVFVSADAALWDRGGGLIYDDVLDITWLQDANYGAGSAYDDGPSQTDGLMSWASAMSWADNLSYYDSVRHVTYTDWRLPKVTDDTGAPGCDGGFFGGDCGYNVDTSTGEMASLFYDTLGNLGWYDTSGNMPQPGYGMTNTGPFTGLPNASSYWFSHWYDKIYAPDNIYAWYFSFDLGLQHYDHYKTSGDYAWAVRNGDVAAVPVPGAVWLFGSALGLLGWMWRKLNT